MSQDPDIKQLRKLYGSGRRTRSRAELHADFLAGCCALSQLGDELSTAVDILDTDLAAIDRTIVGLQQILVALRMPEEPPHAA